MDREPGGGPFDSQTARFLMHWGQRSSRRGLLAAMGKLALRLAGLSMLPLLPVDRSFAAVGNCSTDWRLCGMWGNFCKDCCGGTASLTQCPSCTNVGASWSFCCCYNPDACTTTCNTIIYTDCCGTKSGFTDSQTATCQDSATCHRNPQEQFSWCGATGTYRCTVIGVGASC